MPDAGSYGRRNSDSLAQRLYDASRADVIAIEDYKRRLRTSSWLPKASWAKEEDGSENYIEPEIVGESIDPETREKTEARYSLTDIINLNVPMVITGDMGMGKSALSREVVLRAAGTENIPVYINLNGQGRDDIDKERNYVEDLVRTYRKS